jgi:hypothetical protein
VTLTDGIEPMGIAEGPVRRQAESAPWMSPKNAIVYVENIRRALVDLDPANAETYNANAAAYTEADPRHRRAAARQARRDSPSSAGWSPARARFPISPATTT